MQKTSQCTSHTSLNASYFSSTVCISSGSAARRMRPPIECPTALKHSLCLTAVVARSAVAPVALAATTLLTTDAELFGHNCIDTRADLADVATRAGKHAGIRFKAFVAARRDEYEARHRWRRRPIIGFRCVSLEVL